MAKHVPDQRGIGKRVKAVLPKPLFRQITRTYNAIVGVLPDSVKYGWGEMIRKSKYPYCLIEPTDVVVQVGAPRDLLRSGRSRAMHFALRASKGRCVVVEPDDANVAALRAFVAANGLESRVSIIPKGGWSEKGELRFISSPEHPASNQLSQVSALSEMPSDAVEIVVPVDTIDNILADLGLSHPKIVSITTNGAEIDIINGMKNTIAAGCPYICVATSIQKYHDALDAIGYDYIVRDDRGAVYRQRNR